MSRARCQVTRPCSRCTESLSARYGKVTGVPAEYTASLLGDDDDGAVDNRSEDGRSSLLGVVEAHAARHVRERARKLTDFTQGDSSDSILVLKPC